MVSDRGPVRSQPTRPKQPGSPSGNVGTVFGIGPLELVIIVLALLVCVAVVVGLVVWLVSRS